MGENTPVNFNGDILGAMPLVQAQQIRIKKAHPKASDQSRKFLTVTNTTEQRSIEQSRASEMQQSLLMTNEMANENETQRTKYLRDFDSPSRQSFISNGKFQSRNNMF